ncbi:MAG: histidine kinase dimerization/phospho-acceptor domain-containing protein [Candidatus Omnitrophota bacterium]
MASGDISLQEVSAALARTRADLIRVTDRLIELENMALLAEMTSAIAHELNQPLNVTKIICQGILHDIKKGRFNAEDAAKDLPEIVTQMNKLSEVINHMRVLSRPKQGAPLEREDLNAIVQSALQFVGQQYKNHKIELKEDFAAGLPFIMADGIRLEQTVLSLLDQARRIVERLEKGPKQIILKTYAGAEGRESILEITANVPGAGESFRLTACQKVIEAQNGRLELQNTAEAGSSFKAIFPAVIKEVAA